jgi:hypothetical protein
MMQAPSMIKAATSTSAAIERIARGLEWADAKFGAKKLGVPLGRLGRCAALNLFSPAERGTIYRGRNGTRMWFARLGQVACEVFRSEAGARVVEDLMRRIHDGILA